MGWNHYRVLETLGESGQSCALLAVDKDDATRKVVIKQLVDPERALAEIGVVLRVRHANIVEVYEVFLDRGSYYLVTKYAEGGDLDAMIAERLRASAPSFSARQLYTYFIQLASALQACHDAHIIHRDVKPANIFVDADGRHLYLGDFGVAKALTAQSLAATTFVGSPIWISPEILAGEPYTLSADVWSLGCVFYELATLQKPFDPSGNFATLISRISSGRFLPIPSAVPAPVRDIVESMLRVTPSQRASLREIVDRCQRGLSACSGSPARCSASELEWLHTPPLTAKSQHVDPTPPHSPSTPDEDVLDRLLDDNPSHGADDVEDAVVVDFSLSIGDSLEDQRSAATPSSRSPVMSRRVAPWPPSPSPPPPPLPPPSAVVDKTPSESLGDMREWMDMKRRDVSIIERYLAEHRAADNHAIEDVLKRLPALHPDGPPRRGRGGPPRRSASRRPSRDPSKGRAGRRVVVVATAPEGAKQRRSRSNTPRRQRAVDQKPEQKPLDEERRLEAQKREAKYAEEREQLRAMIKEQRLKMRNANAENDVAVQIVYPGMRR